MARKRARGRRRRLPAVRARGAHRRAPEPPRTGSDRALPAWADHRGALRASARPAARPSPRARRARDAGVRRPRDRRARAPAPERVARGRCGRCARALVAGRRPGAPESHRARPARPPRRLVALPATARRQPRRPRPGHGVPPCRSASPPAPAYCRTRGREQRRPRRAGLRPDHSHRAAPRARARVAAALLPAARAPPGRDRRRRAHAGAPRSRARAMRPSSSPRAATRRRDRCDRRPPRPRGRASAAHDRRGGSSALARVEGHLHARSFQRDGQWLAVVSVRRRHQDVVGAQAEPQQAAHLRRDNRGLAVRPPVASIRRTAPSAGGGDSLRSENAPRASATALGGAP